VKKVDYYAMNQAWKMPKWLGATVGGVFGVIAIGSVFAIVHLTRSPEPPKPAMAAAAPAVAAPAPAPAEAAPAPAAAQEAKPAAPVERVVVAHSRHASKKHDRHAKTVVASAKRPSGMTDAKAQAILAKHEGKGQKKDKDALDKLLGL